MNIQLVSVFLQIAGLIIGLGAVIVIDFHGFLGRKSLYWTKATVSAHKITKPLIWLGTFIYSLGLVFFFSNDSLYTNIRVLLLIPMVLNGVFLSFYISPKLLKMEKKNDIKILDSKTQKRITISLLFSDFAWWLSVFLLVYEVSN